MFRILVAGYLMLLSCNNARLTAPKPQNKVSNSRSEMTSKNPLLDSLNIFLKEKKFNPGAAGWEGYTGAHDPTIKTALTTIVKWGYYRLYQIGAGEKSYQRKLLLSCVRTMAKSYRYRAYT